MGQPARVLGTLLVWLLARRCLVQRPHWSPGPKGVCFTGGFRDRCLVVIGRSLLCRRFFGFAVCRGRICRRGFCRFAVFWRCVRISFNHRRIGLRLRSGVIFCFRGGWLRWRAFDRCGLPCHRFCIGGGLHLLFGFRLCSRRRLVGIRDRCVRGGSLGSCSWCWSVSRRFLGCRRRGLRGWFLSNCFGVIADWRRRLFGWSVAFGIWFHRRGIGR
jgi:hypothetical protein